MTCEGVVHKNCVSPVSFLSQDDRKNYCRTEDGNVGSEDVERRDLDLDLG